MAAAAGPLYRLADYLDQHGRAHRASQIPPAEFWSAAAAHAAPGDQAALGDAAHDRGLYRDAAQLHKNAAASGNPSAALYLSDPPACLRADPRPAHWAAAHAALDDPDGVARLLDAPAGGGRARTRPPRCWPVIRPPTPPSTTRTAWPACWTACGRRARTSRPPRWPTGPPPTPPSTTRRRVADLLDSLRAAGAHEQAAALAGRAAAHAALDDPDGVAACWTACGRRARTSRPPRCWPGIPPPTPPSTTRTAWPPAGRLREAGAHEQAAALLARDPAAHAALDDPVRRGRPAGQPAGGGRARAGRRAAGP